jgi:hypothetical protein
LYCSVAPTRLDDTSGHEETAGPVLCRRQWTHCTMRSRAMKQAHLKDHPAVGSEVIPPTELDYPRYRDRCSVASAHRLADHPLHQVRWVSPRKPNLDLPSRGHSPSWTFLQWVSCSTLPTPGEDRRWDPHTGRTTSRYERSPDFGAATCLWSPGRDRLSSSGCRHRQHTPATVWCSQDRRLTIAENRKVVSYH